MSSGDDADDFGVSHDSSGEDYDDFDYDNLLSSLELTPNLRISNVHEEDMNPDCDSEDMDPHLDPDVSYGEADDSFYVFRGHADEVYSMACSPLDKYLVATGGKDNKVFLWKFGLQDSKLELQGHEDTISTLAFSRDGKFLASGSFDGLIKIWDAQLSIIKCTLEGSGGGVEWLKWHPGLRGYLVLAGSTDCSVRLWDADKGTHLRTFNGHASGVTCGEFSGDGKIICTGSNDASLRIWNPETAESINVRDPHRYHTGGLTCLSINNDSTIAVTGSNDSTVRLVNLSSGEVIRSYYSHSGSVVCCGFAPDTPYTFATGSLDSNLIVWDTLSSAPVCICEHKMGERAEGVTCLLWLAFRPCIITGSTHGRVRMWNCVYGTCLRTYDGHQDMDPDCDDEHLDPDVSYGEADDSFYVFRGHADEVCSMACSPLDKYLVATGGKDNKVFLWKFGLQDSSNLELQGHEDTISTLAFSRDGKFLASGSFDGLIKIWDAQLGIIKCTFEGSGGGVEWLKWHPGLRGHLVLAGSTDCSVRLWDADKGTHLRTFNGHASGVTCGDFSGDGKIICTGSNDASLRIWNPETAESINVRGRRYHKGGLTCLSINNDSTVALTGSNDSTVRLVNLSSGKVIRSYYSHSDSVVCCGFAPNTPYTFATGSLDSKLIVWDTLCPAPLCICEHKTGEKAEGVTCLLWLKFMTCIITGSTQGRVRMWNSIHGTCLRTYNGHQGEIVSLSIIKYCTHIVSISRDHTARVFPMME